MQEHVRVAWENMRSLWHRTFSSIRYGGLPAYPVRVHAPEGYWNGNAFCVDARRKLFFTCAHVAKPDKTIEVLIGKRWRAAFVLDRGDAAGRDLALIAVPDVAAYRLVAAPLTDEYPLYNDRFSILGWQRDEATGHRLLREVSVTVSDALWDWGLSGYFSARTVLERGNLFLPAFPGLSGSPVFTEEGNCIGILMGAWPEKEKYERLAIAHGSGMRTMIRAYRERSKTSA